MPNVNLPVTAGFCRCVRCTAKAPTNVHNTTSWRGKGYHYGTRNWAPKGRGDALYGMELELSSCDATAWRAAVARLGEHLAEVKPDGSLMEMTSHPMTLPYFMTHYPWNLLPELNRLGARGDPSYGGIHVHVNKATFETARHISGWLELIYSNPVPMGRLGGRQNHFRDRPAERDLDALAGEIITEIDLAKAIHTGAVNTIREGRHHVLRDTDKAAIRRASLTAPAAATYYASGAAVNSRRHEDTFEVRFPGASVVPEVAASRLQLVAATVEYARTQPGSLAFGDFRDWASGQRHYGELTTAMKALPGG